MEWFDAVCKPRHAKLWRGWAKRGPPSAWTAIASMHRILLVDDDREFCRLLSLDLERQGFQVAMVHSGEEALDTLRQNQYDLLVLDIMLPLMNGFETLIHLRQFSEVPVIVLSARGNPMDMDLGFRLGAADYLAKPFRREELIVRINAALRRARPSVHVMTPSKEAIQIGDLRILPTQREALLGDQKLDLTASEYEVLRLLVQATGEVVTRATLCRAALGRELKPVDRTLDNVMLSLRRKYKEAGGNPDQFSSARGKGYTFCAL